MDTEMICPLCGGQDFIEFNGRPQARCNRCLSMDRTRLLYLLLKARGRLVPDVSILHFAPELGLAKHLRKFAAEYVSADLEASRYSRTLPKTERVDLCSDDLCRFAGRFDLVLHCHVLEHLPCDIGCVLRRMADCLKPEGEMYFCVPIRRGARTTEDFTLPPDERKRRFGQRNHVRMFGDLDVLDVFQAALGTSITALSMTDYLSDIELQRACIPNRPGLNMFVAGRRHDN